MSPVKKRFAKKPGKSITSVSPAVNMGLRKETGVKQKIF
jgi:hypothetical protein